MEDRSEELQVKIGYRFNEPTLLIRALTHRSRSSETSKSDGVSDNEQLEFLGDAVLGFIVSEALFSQHPHSREGDLSQAKAFLVSAQHLHTCALHLQLGPHLRLGKGEELNGGRERRTSLANAMEAIIAAIHLDGGIEAAKQFVQHHVLALSGDVLAQSTNAKSQLQELAQSLGMQTPVYSIVSTSGPEHAKVFTVEARLDEQRFASASGPSKKAASQEAAELLLQQLQASLAKA